MAVNQDPWRIFPFRYPKRIYYHSGCLTKHGSLRSTINCKKAKPRVTGYAYVTIHNETYCRPISNDEYILYDLSPPYRKTHGLTCQLNLGPSLAQMAHQLFQHQNFTLDKNCRTALETIEAEVSRSINTHVWLTTPMDPEDTKAHPSTALLAIDLLEQYTDAMRQHREVIIENRDQYLLELSKNPELSQKLEDSTIDLNNLRTLDYALSPITPKAKPERSNLLTHHCKTLQ